MGAAVEVLRPAAAVHEAPLFLSDGGFSAVDDRPVNSPTHSCEQGADEQALTSMRCVKMAGFQRCELNGVYVEHNADGRTLGGRETYWSPAMKFFIYYSTLTHTWAIEK